MKARDEDVSREYLDVYHEYAKTLRTWLVGFGIGAPVIFLTQESVRETIIDAKRHRLFVSLCLVGVGCQVFLALVNKTLNWYLYFCHDRKATSTRIYNAMKTFSHCYLFDLILDIIAVVCFATSSIWAAIILS